jgi:hypothetical protein
MTAERVRGALREMEMDRDLKRIHALYQDFDERYINTWETRGILTVPLYLACALVAKLKLRWGEQYESSKDAMHFELTGQGNAPYIVPEVPLQHHEKPRTLRRLMDAAFVPAGRQWQLQPPELLKHKAKHGR